MFENKEPLPQVNKPEAATGVRPEQKVEVVDTTAFENTDKISRELREKGVEKENIDAATSLMKRIVFFDRKVFPENPARFNFALKDTLKGEAYVGFIPPKNDKERSYQICVEDLVETIGKEATAKKATLGLDRKFKLENYQNEDQFLVSVAAHEVRHRVQHDLSIKMFSPEDVKLVKDQRLADIIKFRDMEFKEMGKIFRRDGKSEDFIKEKLGPKEFDAEVIEDLVRHKIGENIKGVTGLRGMEHYVKHYEEIVSIIKMSAPETKLEQKIEVKEGPIDRLKGEIKDMSLELRKEGVPVDEKARIDINKFGDVYSKQSIESDNAWVKDLKGRWENVAASSQRMSGPFGREQIKEKLAKENPLGGVWEMLATKILHQGLGKDFIVARTSEYDDARYKVDNLILDRKTGHVVCAFDEIGATTGERFEEKKNKVLRRNWQKGGADLKYGISFEEKKGKMELKKGSVYQIPLFYLALSEEEIKRTLSDPSREKKIFGDFVSSAREQIKKIREGPVHPKLKGRLDFFERVLGKL